MRAGRVNVRLLCQFVLCVLMARVQFIGINPIAVAVFVVVFSEKRKNNLLVLAVILGIISCIFPVYSVSDGANLVKYILIIMCISIINRLAISRKTYLSRQALAYIAGGVTTVIGMCGSVLEPGEKLILSAGEGILVFILVNLLYKGIHLCEYGKLNQTLSDEQLISVILMLTIAANGLPNPAPDMLSVTEGMLYLLILYISYKYGAAAGAIAGAAAGISAGSQGAVFIGLYCLIGVSTGIVRSAGKFASLLVFIVSGVAAGMMMPQELWKVEELRAFVSAAAGFIFIPKALLVTVNDENSSDNVLIKKLFQQETSRKLNEFAGAFNRLGNMIEKNCVMEPVVNTESVGEIFNELTHTVCSSCTNCSYCWEQRYYDTYHEALNMLGGAEENGCIKKEDVSLEFASRCIHFDDFMRETNQQLEIARISTGWQNRLAINRVLLAEQMKEVSGLINELESEVSGLDRIAMREENELLSLLRAFGLHIKKLVILEKRNNRIEISMKAKSRHNCCVTMKEVSDMIGQVMESRWKAADGTSSIFPKEYETVTFVQDVKFRVLTGIARNARSGENISGDNYSFLTLSSGKVIMTITDGIGCGKLAYEESETVIEMLEQLVEAGFKEKTALRFINSSLVLSDENDLFSTVDMCIINLYTGVCECIKCGAAATFIKKQHGIRIVRSDTVPVGILPEAIPSSSTNKLVQGEYVIMISDGISDSFAIEDKEEYIKEIIQQVKTDNPQEMADYILERARESSGGLPGDDMSVIVAGLWNKL